MSSVYQSSMIFKSRRNFTKARNTVKTKKQRNQDFCDGYRIKGVLYSKQARINFKATMKLILTVSDFIV